MDDDVDVDTQLRLQLAAIKRLMSTAHDISKHVIENPKGDYMRDLNRDYSVLFERHDLIRSVFQGGGGEGTLIFFDVTDLVIAEVWPIAHRIAPPPPPLPPTAITATATHR